MSVGMSETCISSFPCYIALCVDLKEQAEPFDIALERQFDISSRCISMVYRCIQSRRKASLRAGKKLVLQFHNHVTNPRKRDQVSFKNVERKHLREVFLPTMRKLCQA